jgi:hypothetical protein
LPTVAIGLGLTLIHLVGIPITNLSVWNIALQATPHNPIKLCRISQLIFHIEIKALVTWYAAKCASRAPWIDAAPE